MTDIVIGGWYTPDYEPLAAKLIHQLDTFGLPYLFLPVGNISGNWEKKTRMKPIMAQTLLNKIDGASLLLLDVDVVIHGPKSAIFNGANLDADIGLTMNGKISKSKGTTKMHPNSGTMVLNPTVRTSRLLENWINAGEKAPLLATDEATLGAAICNTPGLRIEMLHERMSAGPRTKDPVIEHSGRTGRRSKFVRIRNTTDRLMKHLKEI